MAKSKGCGNRVKGQVSDIIKNSKVKDDGARSDLIEYLNEREIFALTAYLALIPQSGDMEKLRVDVYSFSRNVMPKSNPELLLRKTKEWFSQPAVRYFLEEREKTSSITHAAAPIVDIANIDVENDEGYDERSLSDLEQLKEDVKAMIRKRDEDGVETGEINENALKSFQDLTKLIHQIRYKSKEQLQDNGKFVQIMLPLQCVSCPLYIAEKKRLNL